MPLTYTQAVFSDKERITHTKLNQYFTDIRNYINTTGLVNADIASNAAIVGSKLNLAASTGRIQQISSLALASTPSVILVNTGNAGVLRFDNSGTGSDLFTNAPTLTFDLDHNNDQTGESFKITYNNGATTLFQIQASGTITTPNQTKYVVLSPGHFIGEIGAAVGTSVLFIQSDGIYLDNSGTANKKYVAPARLPNNAKITELRMFYRKQKTAATCNAYLLAAKYANITDTTMASVVAGTASSASYASVVTTSITNATVNTLTNKYWVLISLTNTVLQADTRITAVRIKYTIGASGM